MRETTSNKSIYEAIMEVAWRDFVLFAFTQQIFRAQFMSETGLFLPSDGSPLERMIDRACGASNENCMAFAVWVTVRHFGMVYAPEEFRNTATALRGEYPWWKDGGK